MYSRAHGNALDVSPNKVAFRNISVAVIVVFSIIFISSALAVKWRETVQADAGEHLLELDSVLAEHTRRVFIDAEHRLGDIAHQLERDEPTDQDSLRPLAGSNEMHQVLRDATESARGIFTAAIYGSDGEVLNSSLAWPAPQVGPTLPDFFNDRLKVEGSAFYITRPGVGRVSGKPVVGISREVRAINGKVIGNVLFFIPSKYFADLYAVASLSPGTSIRLWRRDGVLLASYPPQSGVGAPPGPSSLMQVPEGRPSFGERVDFFSHRRQISARVGIADLPVVITVAQDCDAVLAFWYVQLRWLVAATVCIVTLIAAIAVFAQRRVRAEYELIAAAHAAAIADMRLRTLAELEQALDVVGLAIYRTALGPQYSGEPLFVSQANRILTDDAVPSPRFHGVIDHVPMECRAEYDRFLAGLLAKGDGEFEFGAKRADGTPGWFCLRSRRLHDTADGRPVFVSGLADVTEQMALRTERDAAEREATARVLMLGELASSIVHELKQPLSVISLSTENAIALTKAPTPDIERLQARHERILAQITRARSIMDNLAAFSSSALPEARPISLSLPVSLALEMVGPSLCDAEINLRNKVPIDLPLVFGEETRIEQVLINLLLNARDQLANVPVPQRWIALGAEVTEIEILLTVGDSGGGIPLEVEGRLFDSFFTTKPSGKGTGLGLSIASNAMRSMNGSIAAHNGPEGAIFTLRFSRIV